MRIVPLPIARRMDAELPPLPRQNHEPALRPQQRDRMVGNPLEQPGQVVLGSEFAIDLEDAYQPIVGGHDRRPPHGFRRKTVERVGRWSEQRERGTPGAPEGAQLAAARIVPEDFAQITREPSRNIFQHRERLLDVAPSGNGLTRFGGQFGAVLQGPPNPFLLTCLLGRRQCLVERVTSPGLVAAQGRDHASGEGQHRSMRRRVTQGGGRLLQMRREDLRICPLFPSSQEQAFEACLGGVDPTPQVLVGTRTKIVKP